MSTSPSRSPLPQPAAGMNSSMSPPLVPFPYDVIPESAVPRQEFGLLEAHPEKKERPSESSRREAEARAQGRQEGMNEARRGFEEQLGKERASVAGALTQFTRDRAGYFQAVEGEVVQLALSIARKILHREAQLDPLLLAGIVRVALENIDGATGVVLRLHPQNASDWRRYLATALDPADLPEIVEDPSQPPDRCSLETRMGTALIGLEVQLKEIEQGLMDLLAARPAGVR